MTKQELVLSWTVLAIFAKMKRFLFVLTTVNTARSKGRRKKMGKGSRSSLGRALRVDVTQGKITTEDTQEYVRGFIGGRGVNRRILFDELSPQVTWADDANLIIFGAGALVGTLAPGACRTSVDSKNVFNNGVGSSNFGGHFGAELKYAGFDHIVISGRSDEPVYLWIRDGQGELRRASSIWGKTTWETERAIKQELGDNQVMVACIGPAGENLVKSSCIIAEGSRAAGGSGIGAVMGAKKLKAVAVRGHGGIGVAEPSKFMEQVHNALVKIGSSPTGRLMRDKSLYGAFCREKDALWDLGIMPVRNGQDDYWEPKKRERVSGRYTDRYRKKMRACFSCPIGCEPVYEVADDTNGVIRGSGFWINSAMSYAARFDMTNLEKAIKSHFLANQLGLDGDNAAAVISWAFECFERRIISKRDTGGLNLAWGDSTALMEMLKKLAYRKDIGDVLAQGVKTAAEVVGKGSEEFAIHIKGQDALDGIRIRKGWALGIVTSPCAGRHLRGAIGFGQAQRISDKDSTYDDVQYRNQAKYVFWQEQNKAIEDMIGICSYLGQWSGSYALMPSDYIALTNAALGTELTEEDLMLIGRRVHHLEKAFNTIHAGFNREDDYPPKRYINESVKSGPYKGARLDRANWDSMLDEYYELQGWDKKTGWQTENCLEELDLENVANRLKQEGRLIRRQ